MKRATRKVLLVLLSLCIIVSLTACKSEPEEYSEEWYAKQIYIDRICIEKGETNEEPIKIKMIIRNSSQKPIGYGFLVRGRFYDTDGNVVNGSGEYAIKAPLSLSLEKKISNEILNCEFEYSYPNSWGREFTIEDVSKIETFKIIGITVGYYFDGTTEDSLIIDEDKLKYVISQNAYNDDYDISGIQTIIGKYS